MRRWTLNDRHDWRLPWDVAKPKGPTMDLTPLGIALGVALILILLAWRLRGL